MEAKALVPEATEQKDESLGDDKEYEGLSWVIYQFSHFADIFLAISLVWADQEQSFSHNPFASRLFRSTFSVPPCPGSGER